jgi:flagellin
MGFRINTNIASISAQKNLSKMARSTQSTFSKLSSGKRITSAADDAAGLAISEKMSGHIRSMKQANRNANDGISMIQVAEGAFGEIGSMLNRVRELSIQSASDTVGNEERTYIDMEYQNLKSEIQRISDSTDFNGKKLLNGEGEKYDFQIGIHNDANLDRISYDSSRTDATLSALGIEGIDALEKGNAQEALEQIDFAISKTNENRAELGALQNRLIVSSSNLDTGVENLSAANSRILDLDYAEATAENTKNNIITQAGTSVLAQANNISSNALRLLS